MNMVNAGGHGKW